MISRHVCHVCDTHHDLPPRDHDLPSRDHDLPPRDHDLPSRDTSALDHTLAERC
eukprot:CAMPEP_0181305546 /NCGR_PEP_ID=MMETSP1101-20121128/9792_1 /TAXON_ID=46948 /ORGANISM="Rhodomonas abbreviata, Strain Caron Lab Isolate" /LENGTH=53 /DNA_ID=CAMNT_0023411479 /DNA_START=126 /DNA_END=287 /DNA_ORIENTATION=-